MMRTVDRPSAFLYLVASVETGTVSQNETGKPANERRSM